MPFLPDTLKIFFNTSFPFTKLSRRALLVYLFMCADAQATMLPMGVSYTLSVHHSHVLLIYVCDAQATDATDGERMEEKYNTVES